MQTPSLRNRVVGAGVLTVAALLVGLAVLLLGTVRATRLDAIDASLDAADVVVRAQASLSDPQNVPALAATTGITVRIIDVDGQTYGPPAPQPSVTRRVELKGGLVAFISASRTQLDSDLRRLAGLAGLCILLISTLAALMLRWISEVALAPLGQVVAAAGRTAEGQRGERLQPEQPDTELGTMARAYDQMLDSLEASEEASWRLASIVESSDEAVIGVDADGQVFSWNRAAERIFAVEAGDTIGQSVLDVFAQESRTDVAEALALAARGTPVRGREVLGHRAGGPQVDLSLTLSPVADRDGSVIGTSVIARDVSLEHRMAQALQATLGNLEIALDQARTSEARTRRFLDDAAHQLRTPITGIQACAEALLRTTAAADRELLLVALVGETSRAGRLISSLLTLARLDARQGGLRLGPCDVVAICDGEADRLRSRAPGLEVTVRRCLLSSPPIADENAVREALGNLLDNARRHASSRVDIEVTDRGSRVELRVANDGPPIPPDKVAAAFERFISLDGGGGTGLGLPIARDLARACGGGLTYEDESFVRRLPLAGSAAGSGSGSGSGAGAGSAAGASVAG
ncbi:MAG: sensor histidine kinase [Acidimicrobiales bacterium]